MTPEQLRSAALTDSDRNRGGAGMSEQTITDLPPVLADRVRLRQGGQQWMN